MIYCPNTNIRLVHISGIRRNRNKTTSKATRDMPKKKKHHIDPVNIDVTNLNMLAGLEVLNSDPLLTSIPSLTEDKTENYNLDEYSECWMIIDFI